MLDTNLSDLNLFVALGGFDGKEPCPDVSLLDLDSASWMPGPEMSFGRRDFAVAAIGPDVFVLGGFVEDEGPIADVEYLNIAHGQWRDLPEMEEPRFCLGAAAAGGFVYVVGGRGGGRALKSMEIYDAEEVGWGTGPPLAVPRTAFGLASLDGRLYAVGGEVSGLPSAIGGTDGNDPVNLLDIYEIESGTWHAGPPMRQRRSDLAVVATRGKVFAIGGYGVKWQGGVYLSSIEVYDVDSQQWEAGPTMTYARAGLGAGLFESRVLVLGGPFAGVGATTLETMDLEVVPAKWTEGPPMPGRRYGVRAVACTGVDQARDEARAEDLKAHAREELAKRLQEASQSTGNPEQLRRSLASAIVKGLAAGLDDVELEEARRQELDLSSKPSRSASKLWGKAATGSRVASLLSGTSKRSSRGSKT